MVYIDSYCVKAILTGAQELHGLIWLSNGNWMSRWEHDGSEGWQLNSLPEIPDELK